MHTTRTVGRWLALLIFLLIAVALVTPNAAVHAAGGPGSTPGPWVGLVSRAPASAHTADICIPFTSNCIGDPLSGVLSAISGIASAIAALPQEIFQQVSAAFGTFLAGLEQWITSQVGGWIDQLVKAVATQGLDLWHGLWNYVGAHIFGWLGDLIDGIAGAIGSFIAQMATDLIAVVTTTPQFLGPGSGLTGLYTSFWTFALAIAGSLFVIEMLRGLALSWGATTLGPSTHGLRRGAVGLLVLQLLNPQTGLLNTWITIVNGLVGEVTSATNNGPNGLAHALSGYVDFALKAMVASPGFALTIGLGLVTVVSVILLILCAVIVLQRLGGLFVLGGLIVVAPLCAVALISAEFRQFGRWWFVNFVSYSFWGFGYAVVLCVIGEMLVVGGPASSSLAGTMGTDLLYHFALPFAGVLVLLRVPRIMDTLLGAMGSKLVGATAIVDAGAAAARSATSTATSMMVSESIRRHRP